MSNYQDFLDRKAQLGQMSGFEPLWMPSFLFDFQQALVDWALRKGRAAIFADCGLGKTPMQLVWADNVVRQTNRPVLILTPLAVSHQTIKEAEKFAIEAARNRTGSNPKGIIVTNYERLHYFDPNDFSGCVCDESSILKSYEGQRRRDITEFMRKMHFRLLCTATAAPNDYVELGTSSEALGEISHSDMLARFFKNDQGNSIRARSFQGAITKRSFSDESTKWRFKGHAELPFWRWVSSWARAIRRPSDLGFDDGRFVLPKLVERSHMIDLDKPADGFLFSLPAVGLAEQRGERRRTIEGRCEKAAALVRDTDQPAIMWCHLNDEGDILERLVSGSVQVSGDDEDDAKEEKFSAFVSGQARVLITKPKIGAWGLNFQHCQHITSFPSHSFEQYYQAIRRCWRFGQTRPVISEVITTEGEKSILANMQRKALAADKMFSDIIANMQQSNRIARGSYQFTDVETPQWMM